MATNKLDNLLQYLDDADSETTAMLSSRASRSGEESMSSVTSSLPPYPGLTPSGPTPARRRGGRSRYDEEDNAQQQDFHELDKRISGFSLRSQTSSQQKSFIWDQVDEDGEVLDGSNSSRKERDLSALGRPLPAGSGASLPESSFSTIQSQYGDIEAKVESMQAELKDRRTAVKALQSELESLRKSSAEYTKKAVTKWQQELSLQRQKAALSASRHTEFQAGLDKDIGQLQEKLEELDDKASKIVRSREAELELVRKDCMKELKAAREMWLDAEKRRLSRMAEKKEAEIKAQAVRQLEPELHNLISGNKKKLAAQRENNEIALKDEKLRLDKELQQTLIDSLKAFEAELQEEAETMRRMGQQRKREAMAENEKAAQKLKREYNSELESERVRFEAERKRRRDFILQEECSARSKQSNQLQQAISQYQVEASATSERYRQEIENEIRKTDLETERWKKAEMEQMKEDIMQKKKNNEESMRSQRETELNMVMQKLEEDTEAEIASFRADLHEKYNRIQSMRKQKLEQSKAEEKELFQRFLEKTEFEKSLKTGLQSLAQEKDKIQQEVSSLENKIEEINLKQKDQAAAAQIRAMQLRSEGERERNRLLHEYEDHAVKLDSILSEVKVITPRLVEEEKMLKEKIKVEYSSVQMKIDMLLKKKAQIIDDLAYELKELKAENEDLAGQIDAHREKQIS